MTPRVRRPQIVSDVTGLPQDLPTLTVGVDTSSWNPVAERLQRHEGAVGVYSRLYDLYLQGHPALAETMHTLSTIGAETRTGAHAHWAMPSMTRPGATGRTRGTGPGRRRCVSEAGPVTVDIPRDRTVRLSRSWSRSGNAGWPGWMASCFR